MPGGLLRGMAAGIAARGQRLCFACRGQGAVTEPAYKEDYREGVVVVGTDREARRRRGSLYLFLTGAAGLVLVAILIALRPFGGPLNWGIRAAALLGYLAILLSVVSSAYMRELFLWLGRPFIKVHHIVSLTGLALVTLHPLGVAARSADLRVFLPDFSSPYLFFSLGGRPAWYLIGAAVLAAVFRKKVKDRWRLVHYLNYIAFFLATAHAIMIGTDFVSLLLKGIAIVMALAVVGVFVQKRVERSRVKRRK
jgi:sulfoxide reductase heme-binding subunit YedZ